MIPSNTNAEALNQWVFPAEAAEQLILDSVPQNQFKVLLGCSKTQAEHDAAVKLVMSVAPVEEGSFGLSFGAYNRIDMKGLLETVCVRAEPVSGDTEGFLGLTNVCKGRSSTLEVLRWQIYGQLRCTRLIGGIQRIDHIRFSVEEVQTLARSRAGTNLHRLTLVASRLGLNLALVKQLTSSDKAEPLLPLVSREECDGRQGAACVSTAAIEAFSAAYVTLGQAAKIMV